MRRFIAALCTLALGLSLAACAGTPSSTNENNSANSNQAQSSTAAQADQTQKEQPDKSDADKAAEKTEAAAKTNDTQPAKTAKPEQKKANKDKKGEKPDYSKGTHHAVIKIKGYGRVRIEIKSEYAPVTAEEFCLLVKKKYYDGKSLYWLLPDIYARLGSASKKSRNVYCIRGEFEEAGFDGPPLSLKRGTIAMSRAKDGRSSDASTLILFLSDCSYLNGKYAGFARVTSGMGVIDEINAKVNSSSKKDKIAVSKNGKIVESKDRPVIKSIRMVD